MLGAMDMPADFRPTQHASERKLPFLHMSDDLPRHLKTSVKRPDGKSHEIHPLLAQGHLETDASLDEIVERLTSIGLEVEHVTTSRAGNPLFIAKG